MLLIPAVHGHLESLYKEATEARFAALVCHPHPQHGGTMHTKAVFRAAQALNRCGGNVLRFNFRGVGLSTGSYANGDGEVDDVHAALDWLESSNQGRPVLLAGFSFGSRAALRAARTRAELAWLVGLGVPVRNWDFAFLQGESRPLLCINGENDEFGTPAEVQASMQRVAPQAEVRGVAGADHYFTGTLEAMQSVLEEWTRKQMEGIV